MIDEAVQARFLVRAYALLLSANVPRIYWYLMRDYQGLSMGRGRDDHGYSRQSAYRALATLVEKLKGARFARREPSPEDLYSFLFLRDNGEEERVIWSLAPRRVSLAGATSIVDLAGAPRSTISPVALDDSPLFVAGPLRGWPPGQDSSRVPIAQSHLDFGMPDRNGWSYGFFVGESTLFEPLTEYRQTDWKELWTSPLSSIEVSADEQHPSVARGIPVAAVRRWRSTYDGKIRVAGHFRCTAQGDGVGISMAVDGIRRFRKLLGGGASVALDIDLVEAVHRGTLLDFAVDPGPKADIEYDATSVRISIQAEP